jgi:hypothetical protein
MKRALWASALLTILLAAVATGFLMPGKTALAKNEATGATEVSKVDPGPGKAKQAPATSPLNPGNKAGAMANSLVAGPPPEGNGGISADDLPRRLPAGPPDPMPATQAKTTEVSKAGLARSTLSERHALLEAVGALTSADYFQIYLTIGFVAEGKSRGIYTDKDARKVLDTVLVLLNLVENKLSMLGNFDLDKEDRDSLEHMIVLAVLLREQGERLQAFWLSKADADAAKYERARKDSWEAISKLLGISR